MPCCLPEREGHPLNTMREETKYIYFHNFSDKINEYDLFPHSSGEAAQELVSRELQEDSKEKDM